VSRSPTLFDVARRAGVSTSTVSRVLNDHPYASSQARQSVEKAIAELGYQRNEIARSLRTNSTLTAGLIVTELQNEVFASIAHGAEGVLSASNRVLIVGSSGGVIESEARIVAELLRRGVDGLILALVDERSHLVEDQLAQSDVPVVLIDRDAPGIVADRVLTGHSAGVREAVDDLRQHGHTAIALIAPPTNVRPGREVYAAFTSAMGDDRLTKLGPLTADFGDTAMRELLNERPGPTAVLISGTQVLVGVLTALQDMAVQVPQDLSLISYDDSAAARFYNPPISVLVRDTALIGRTAAELLLERIDQSRSTLQTVVIPTEYMRRGSVANLTRSNAS
jgi:LacI family transcriptional regulator